MQERAIYVSDTDFERIERLVLGPRRWRGGNTRDGENLRALEAELDRARVVPAGEIPAGVVTMNAEVRVTDLDGGQERRLRLVFPGEADIAQGRISVLAPVGTALLGYRVGDVVRWQVPGGLRRYRIDAVVPEAPAPEPAAARS